MSEKKCSNYDLQVDLAREIFLQYDQEKLIRKFGLDCDERWIRLTYLNAPCRINRENGRVEEWSDGEWSECRSYNTVMTIYDLLCYSKGEAAPTLRGEWCAIGSFTVMGGQDTGGFTNAYAQFFLNRAEDLKRACVVMGGKLQKPVAGADVTCIFPVTDFFPVMLQFWDGDEEFGPKLSLRWDRNTIRFLHFETTFFLQGDLLGRLKRLCS